MHRDPDFDASIVEAHGDTVHLHHDVGSGRRRVHKRAHGNVARRLPHGVALGLYFGVRESTGRGSKQRVFEREGAGLVAGLRHAQPKDALSITHPPSARRTRSLPTSSLASVCARRSQAVTTEPWVGRKSSSAGVATVTTHRSPRHTKRAGRPSFTTDKSTVGRDSSCASAVAQYVVFRSDRWDIVRRSGNPRPWDAAYCLNHHAPTQAAPV